MVVRIYTNEIINQVKLTSHNEVSAITDVDARYRAQAGSDKTEEINRCVQESLSRLSSRCSRFLLATHKADATNVMHLPEYLDYELVLSERRERSKTDDLTNAMHHFCAEYTLAKFYSLVSQGELSNKHSLLAIDAGNEIDKMLYTKQPPRV